MIAAGPDSPSRPVSAASITPKAILGRAWRTFAAAWPTCLFLYWGSGAACWLILNLLVVVLAAFNLVIGDPMATRFLEFLSFVGLVLVPVWLWLAQKTALLKLVRGEPLAPEDLFRGASYLLTAVLAIGIVLALAAIPCLVFYGSVEALLASQGAESVAATFRRLLPAQMPTKPSDLDGRLVDLIIAGMGVGYGALFAARLRLRTFPFLIVDRNAGVLDSLATAMRLSRGRFSALFVIHLAQFGLNFLGLLLVWVGLLVTLPLTALISAVTYDALAAELPPVEWAEDDDQQG